MLGSCEWEGCYIPYEQSYGVLQNARIGNMFHSMRTEMHACMVVVSWVRGYKQLVISMQELVEMLGYFEYILWHKASSNEP